MHLSAIVEIYESGDPTAALPALARRLADQFPLHCAFWARHAERGLHAVWPDPFAPSAELLDVVLHTLQPEVFPLGSEFPDRERFPDAELLVLPLGEPECELGSVALIAARASFGQELDVWAGVTAALARIAKQHRSDREAAAECTQLRRRAEESEALHTLGLATNRTLDPEEVLNLVARFARTLLGAHYVTVNTSRDGQIHAVAHVGLQEQGADADDYFLARKVVEAAKPLTVGGEGAHLWVADFPFHAAQGMQSGLGIPLSLFGDTFGALVIGYRRPYEPTPRETRLALTLAGHAAVAIANAWLHHDVEQRSGELATALDELRQVSRQKERFFAFMNHELRTPLNAVIGYHTLLLGGVTGELPGRTATYLGKAQDAAQNLLGLVNDILDLSKMSEGKMQLVVEPWPLKQIVDEALASVQLLADERGVHLDAEFPVLPPLKTDAKRLRQVLMNLLSNAVKFGRGEVRLEVLPGEAWLEFRVSDDGAGIAPEHLERIFQPYEQTSSADAHRGTGLGLPISRQLARLLGGELRVESEVGVGSTFVLRLPQAAEEEVRAGTTQSSTAG